MAAMTPRRVLGPLDSNRIVHTPPVAGKQPVIGGSGSNNSNNSNNFSPVKRLASPPTVNPALLSPMTASPYVATPPQSLTAAAAAAAAGSATAKRSPERSTLGGRVGRSPKRRRGVEQHGFVALSSHAGSVMLEQSDAAVMARRMSTALNSPNDDIMSSQEVLKNSPSLSALFDNAMDSQSTSFTELAEDLTQPEVAMSDAGAERRPQAVRSDGARQNAEALRLRLRMAMYKVRTNQISLPLSQLSIISETTRPRSSHQPLASLSRRTPLPASTVSVPPSPFPPTPTVAQNQRPQSRSRPSTAVSTSTMVPIPLSAPAPAPASVAHHLPAFESPVKQRPLLPSAMATTPILPRLWRGETGRGVPISAERGTSWTRNDEGEWEMEREMDLTSSVVKGRAAEGLLGLMSER